MRMKAKPAKPTRKKISVSLDVRDVQTLDDILEFFENYSPSDVIVDYDYDYYDAPHIYFTALRDETDDEFNSRMKDWERKMKDWNRWYEDHKLDIEEFKESNKKKAEENATKKKLEIEKKIEALKKDLEKIK
jgi:hypothetical protein